MVRFAARVDEQLFFGRAASTKPPARYRARASVAPSTVTRTTRCDAAALFNFVCGIVLLVVLAAIADATCTSLRPIAIQAICSPYSVAPRRGLHVQELKLQARVATEVTPLHGLHSCHG